VNTKEAQTQNQTQTNIIHPKQGLMNLTVLARVSNLTSENVS
jgi:hypothetical protein